MYLNRLKIIARAELFEVIFGFVLFLNTENRECRIPHDCLFFKADQTFTATTGLTGGNLDFDILILNSEVYIFLSIIAFALKFWLKIIL